MNLKQMMGGRTRKVKDAIDWDNYPYSTKDIFRVWKNEKMVERFENKEDALSYAKSISNNENDLVEVEKLRLYGEDGVDGSDSECIYSTNPEYSSHDRWEMNISDSRRVKDSEDVVRDARKHCDKDLQGNQDMIMEFLDSQCMKWHLLTYSEYKMLCNEYGVEPLPMGFQPRKTAATKANKNLDWY